MTLKDIELELIELRKEHEAMAEVVKHHIKNFDKLRNWHKLESQANVVVKTKIAEEKQNRHNLDIVHLGACTKCGKVNFMNVECKWYD